MSTKDRIVSTMYDLVAQKGYDKASLGQIADAMGIKKASIYYYFKSKEEIFIAIFNELLEDISIMHEKDFTPDTYKDYLVNYSEAYIKGFTNDPRDLKVVMEFYIQSQRLDSIQSLKDDMFAKYTSQVNSMLEIGLKLGVFKKDFDLDLNTQKVLHIIFAIEYAIVFNIPLNNTEVWKDLVENMFV